MKRLMTMSMVLLGLLLQTTLFAQTASNEVSQNVLNSSPYPPAPFDTAIRKGVLPNGLTYYIRHNEEPKGQANFYIAQKVGSILEDESQRGLAHFLEHMCFNGTQKFPGNRIVKYCESIGIEFGGDLNAYTSIDETVYNIDNVPLDKEGAVDSCLWILHDWADGLLLLPEEIDKERGVIHEEWRTRHNAMMRMYEQLLPRMYPNNRYGERLPIGLMSVVDSFPYQVLRDYYEKWYRPDQQGIVVVGDINVDEIEQKIKDIFNTIEKPVDPAERFYVPVENNVEPIVAFAKDKEQAYAMSYIFLKHDAVTDTLYKKSLYYWLEQYCVRVINIMIQQRLDEILHGVNPPFSYASISEELNEFFLAKTKGSLQGAVVFDADSMTTAITTIYREMVRMVQNGFLQSEYDRAKAEYLSQVEKDFNSRNKKKSSSYCREIVRHFIDMEPCSSVEQTFVWSQNVLPAEVEVVNALLKRISLDSNLVVVAFLPDKEGVNYPTEEEIKEKLVAISKEKVPQYVDNTKSEPLVANLPKPGKVKLIADDALGYKKIVLKNGVTIYLKQTDFNPDEIRLNAFSFGGKSLYEDNEYINLLAVNELKDEGGRGNFSKTDLDKALTGKQVSLQSSIYTFRESLSGKSTVKDFETLLQLTYLTFTAIREDKDAFNSWKTKTAALLANKEKNPRSAFNDSINMTLLDHSPRAISLQSDMLDKIDYERCLQIARERFKNPADFTFIITGAIDEKTALPLLCQYLGSINVKEGNNEQWKPRDWTAKGVINNIFERDLEIPSVSNCFIYSNPLTITLQNNVIQEVTRNVLDILFTEKIREEEGGTYGVGIYLFTEDMPEKDQMTYIMYNTSPEKYEFLNAKMDSLLKDMAVTGPNEHDLQKTKDLFIKNYKENLHENHYHADAKEQQLRYNYDLLADYQKALEAVTKEDVRKAVEDILKANNKITVIMKPTTKTATTAETATAE